MKKIKYSIKKTDLDGLNTVGFFDGWPNKPSEKVLQKSIENADYIVLAIDTEKDKLVGYITALSDDVLAAYIPFLEVKKNYQHEGVGGTLIKEILKQLTHLYMIDLVCDKELADFYKEAGFKSWHAMIKRNYTNQSGSPYSK